MLGGLRLAGGWLDFMAFEVIERNGSRLDRRLAGLTDFLERDWGRRTLNAADMFEALREPRPRIAGLSLDRPRIMGIVNVTPDSFSDGGRTPRRRQPSSMRSGWRRRAPTSSTSAANSTRPGAAADHRGRGDRPRAACDRRAGRQDPGADLDRHAPCRGDAGGGSGRRRHHQRRRRPDPRAGRAGGRRRDSACPSC